MELLKIAAILSIFIGFISTNNGASIEVLTHNEKLPVNST